MNKLKQTFTYVFLAIITSVFFSCEKQPGEGGNSEITGLVYKLSTYQNALTGEIDTIYYQLDSGKDIYIIYSGNESDFYDDKVESNWNGQYKFDFLRKGKYIIFTYADSTDALNNNYDFPIFKHIEIEANNSSYNLSDFVINK